MFDISFYRPGSIFLRLTESDFRETTLDMARTDKVC